MRLKTLRTRGGSLSAQDTKDLLKQSYARRTANVGRFTVDKELSGQRAQVYRDNNTGEVVVSHRGTASASDWLTDLGLAFGYKGGARFKHAKDVEEAAKKKYGKVDTTIGHSLGASLAESATKKGDQVIRVNGPTTPAELFQKQRKGVYNVRTSNDPVSALARFRWYKPKSRNLTIASRSNSLLTEHGTDTLGRIDPQQILGA